MRYYREEAGFTLLQLEEVSGVSYTQISRIETGASRSPRTGTLKALADALGLTIKDLVIHDLPDAVPSEPGLTEENQEKLDAKRREWDARDEEKRREGSPNGAGGGEEL